MSEETQPRSHDATITVQYWVAPTGDTTVVLRPDPQAFQTLDSLELTEWRNACDRWADRLNTAIRTKRTPQTDQTSLESFLAEKVSQLEDDIAEIPLSLDGSKVRLVPTKMTRGEAVSAITDQMKLRSDLPCFSILSNGQGGTHPHTLYLEKGSEKLTAYSLVAFRERIRPHIWACCGCDGSRGITICDRAMTELMHAVERDKDLWVKAHQLQPGSHYALWGVLESNANPSRPMNSKYSMPAEVQKST